MATIIIPDEMYDKVVQLANRIKLQNNRATAKPYIFQVRTQEKIWHSGRDGDHVIIMDDDYNVVGPYNFETVKAIADRIENELPKHTTDDLDVQQIWQDETVEWLQKRGYTVNSYSYTAKLQNAFLTEKGCKDHIAGNLHHYDQPDDYLSYAPRNAELELVFDLLNRFAS